MATNEKRPDEQWWAINGETIMDALTEAHAGGDPKQIYEQLRADSETEDFSEGPTSKAEYDDRCQMVRQEIGDRADEMSRLLAPGIRSPFYPEQYEGADLETLSWEGAAVAGWVLGIETFDPLRAEMTSGPSGDMFCVAPLMQSLAHTQGILLEVWKL